MREAIATAWMQNSGKQPSASPFTLRINVRRTSGFVPTPMTLICRNFRRSRGITPINSLRSPDRGISNRKPASPNTFEVDHNDALAKILCRHRHQYSPDAFETFGFAVIAAAPED